MAKRITKCHLIGSEGFQSIWMNNFKIQNLYMKNIMFACSLPMSSSTWHSDHSNGPGGYMSRVLKSENIKYQKAPTRRSYYLAIRPAIIPSYIIKSQKRYSYFILDYFTILKRPSRPTRLYNQDPP
jgi:Na+-transporting NADH:ubiquinone oxidoreductase subunit NqrF